MGQLVGERAQAEQLERRRQQVDLAGGHREAPAGAYPGAAHDPRHPHRRVVGEQPVIRLAVLTQALSVVGDHHDQDLLAVGQPGLLEQPTELGIHVGDLAIVRTLAVPLGEGRRRLEHGVRVEQVDPLEETLAGLESVEPVAGRVDGASGAALRVEARRAGGASGHVVVVMLEPARQAEPSVEHCRGDERTGAEPGVAQQPGQRRQVRGQTMQTVLAHAVRRRVETGEHRGVRRQRHRRGGEGALEQRALPRQLAQGRSLDRGAVGLEPVRPGGVQGDQQEGTRLDCGPVRRAVAAGGTAQQQSGGRQRQDKRSPGESHQAVGASAWRLLLTRRQGI